MYLSKRSNRNYYIHYTNLKGKKTCKSTGCKLKSEANKYLSSFEKEFNRLSDIGYSSIIFSRFSFEFLRTSEGIHSEKTTRDYKATFKFFRSYIGDPQLDQISIKLIADYIDYRIQSSSIYQARKDLINLRSAFGFAVRNEYIKKNPCENIRGIKLPEKQPLFFYKLEFNRFLDSINNEDFYDLVLLGINTGMRQMELLTLTGEQIDLNKELITLDNRSHVTKSKKIRVIPINRRARIALENRNAEGKLFSFSQAIVIHLFGVYRKKSGIRSELTFHSLRHTFASWLVQCGVPILNVSKLLRHSDIRTTQIYAHVSNNELASSVMMLD